MVYIDTKKVLWKTDEGIVTVLLLETGRFYKLNRVGSSIWTFLSEGQSRAEVFESLAKTYDTSREQLILDFEIFTEEMIRAGLLEQKSKAAT